MDKKKTRDIFQQNLERNLAQTPDASMRNLSVNIDASESYIQQILSKQSTPSFDKLDAISEYFNMESWEMLFSIRDDSNEVLAIIQLLNTVPRRMLPLIKAYINYMIQYEKDMNSEKQ